MPSGPMEVDAPREELPGEAAGSSCSALGSLARPAVHMCGGHHQGRWTQSLTRPEEGPVMN